MTERGYSWEEQAQRIRKIIPEQAVMDYVNEVKRLTKESERKWYYPTNDYCF